MNVNSPDFTLQAFRSFLAEQDDRRHNSLCVSGSGNVYFRSWSPNEPRPQFPEDGFRFETFAAGNDYVGPRAATSNFAAELYAAVKRNRDIGAVGYIDVW